jgi:hypothetical protein
MRRAPVWCWIVPLQWVRVQWGLDRSVRSAKRNASNYTKYVALPLDFANDSCGVFVLVLFSFARVFQVTSHLRLCLRLLYAASNVDVSLSLFSLLSLLYLSSLSLSLLYLSSLSLYVSFSVDVYLWVCIGVVHTLGTQC